MFKVGDRVKVTKDKAESAIVLKGDTGTIIATTSYSYKVEMDLQRFEHSKIWHFSQNCLKLIKENKVKQTINYHKLGDSVILNYAGRTVTVKKGDERWEPVVKALQDSKTNPSRLQDIPDIVDTEANFARNGLELRNGRVVIDGDMLPSALEQRLLELMKEAMPVDILVKFWQNLKQNPSFNSRQMLYKFLEHNGHPLTADGCFIAYRGVTNDFKDCHTGKFNNAVGAVCEVPRDQVDDNPNNTCSHGLHVACFDYAKGFGPKLIEVKVNPKDVVAVPVDYNGTKMRVCRFEVMDVCQMQLAGPVYKPEEIKKHNLRDAKGRFVSKKKQEENLFEDDDYYSSDC